MGQFDSTFEIRHHRKWLFEGVDSIDIDGVNEALSKNSIKEWLKPLDKRSRWFKEAFENFYLALVKAEPDMVERPTPRQLYLLRMLSEISDRDDFQKLSEKCTNSKARAVVGAKALVTAIAKIVDDEDLKIIEELDKIDESMQGVLSDMQQFLQRAACGQPISGKVDATGRAVPGTEKGEEEAEEGDGETCEFCGRKHPQVRPKTAKEMGLTAEEARKRARELVEQMGELNEKLNEKLEENKERFEAIKQAFTERAPKQANKDMDIVDKMVNHFGTEPGELAKMDMEDILKLVDQYKDDPKVNGLIDKMGHMDKVARKVEKRITKRAPNRQLEPMVLSDDLPNLMAHEKIALRHPTLKKDFKARLINQELECYDTEGEETECKGPVVFCKDTSYSMHGVPDTWCSALYLTMASRMCRKHRESVLINFSSPGQLRCTEFHRGESFAKYIDEASYMFGGGTCFETPLTKALEYIEMSRYDKADIVFMTDGMCWVGDEFLKRFLRVKHDRKFKVLSILINIQAVGDNVIKQFSDNIELLTDFQKDEDVLATAFAL